MVYYALAFLIGDGFLQLLPALPDVPGWIACSCMLIMISFLVKRKWLTVLMMVCLGFTFSAWYAQSRLAARIPLAFTTKKIIVTGVIAAVPSHMSGQSLQFRFHVTQPFIGNVRLTWREPPTTVRVGQVWRLFVRLQLPRGTANLGGFDFTAWSMVQGIDGLGYVLNTPLNQLLIAQSNFAPLQQLRQYVFDTLLAIMPENPYSHWIPALILGERQGISPMEWRILRLTGTNHLMAIAGLHIGLLVALTHVVTLWLWRRSGILCLYFPAQYAAAALGLLMAILYSMLAGFSLPAERASIMLTVIVTAILTKRLLSSWQVFAIALLLVLIINPLQILTDSFWLSFVTIGLIFYGMQNRVGMNGWWWRWGRVQWVISVGLLPLSLFLFHEFSLIAFLANSLAIPWTLFIILPCCFAAMLTLFLYTPLAHVFLVLALHGINGLMVGLAWFAALPFAAWHNNASTFDLALAMMGVLLALSPLPSLIRRVSVIWIAPLIFYQAPTLRQNELKLTVLDVGQGLSVIVQTAHHTLVYDAGARFQSGSDMGERVVVPFLQQQGITKIDTLVISHDDNDHRGGVQSVLAHFPTRHLFASRPQHGWQVRLCDVSTQWQWDGIRFAFLNSQRTQHSKNNDSCVLHIGKGQASVLLPGDIEKGGERELITRSADLRAALVVAPHHGSKTSSTAAFIAAIDPNYVVYSVGYHNQYHFPHDRVVSAYAKQQAQQWLTSREGMLEFTWLSDHRMNMYSYRQVVKHYWDID